MMLNAMRAQGKNGRRTSVPYPWAWPTRDLRLPRCGQQVNSFFLLSWHDTRVMLRAAVAKWLH